MNNNGAPGGGLIPFRTLVLDEDGATLVPRSQPTSERARQFRAQADAPATVRAYAADWRQFERWCREHGHAPFRDMAPLEPVVGEYLASIGTAQAMSTLRRSVAAIVRQARLARVPFDTKSPDIREVLRGIGNIHRRDPRQAAALTTPEIQKLVRACGHGLAGLRDRTLILLCFAGALRRSELVTLERQHVQWTARGLTLRIARSKTDNEGKNVGIPLGRYAETCPVSHLRRWVEAAKIEDGALFRRVDRWGKAGTKPMNPDSIRLVLARLAATAGMVGTPLEPISPHGLRAGFITTAYGNGVSDERIMEHTRQKSLDTMRGYVRSARLDRDSPAGNVGL